MPRAKIASWCLLVVPVGCVIAACSSPVETQGRANTGVTVFEGARLITGDGSAPIQSSAFIVENTQFTRVGRRGELQVPAGATRVDLTGKTVMPTKVDLHGHIGFQHVADGTMAKEYYTRGSPYVCWCRAGDTERVALRVLV
jgi:imidazolonepropionase-like amidohydrolase